jgi:PAS domain S-box-containing protein
LKNPPKAQLDVNIDEDFNFLDAPSDMAALIRSRDWSMSPLGPLSGWPQSLRTTVSLCLASNFPINIVWGPQHIQIYNDGYRVLCGDKHPDSLGMDYKACWESAWPVLGEPFEQARQGKTSFLENQRMFLFRYGYLEETFFTFSLSPIRDESGGYGGIFHPVTETTTTILSERRTRAVRDLTARLANAKTGADVAELTLASLSEFAFDLPFVLLYERRGNQHYGLVGATGIDSGTAISPLELAPGLPAPWPLQDLLANAAIAEVGDLRALIGDAPCGPYPEAPEVGFAFPVHRPGADGPVALMLTAASPRLPLDDTYRGFIDLIAAAYSAALARVAAMEEERRRLDMLAALDRAKTIFFSNVSHEFRTPLTLMLGPLDDLLQNHVLPADQQALATIARRNAQRLLKLVNTLLDFSRMESGRAGARFEPIDLAAFTAELTSGFRSACERAGLRLLVDTPPLQKPVWVDRDMWEKIILNLMSNAFKFTLEGTIAVTLNPGPLGATLTIADTGVGIPDADLPHVFDRFHRVEGRAGRSVEGTGIGLALVREMVELHGGAASVDSTPGQGTVFTVSIPYGEGKAEALETPQPAAPSPRSAVYIDEATRWLHDDGDRAAAAAGAPQAAKAVRGHVLLADDNADMRAYVGRVLEENGYVVEAVTNGAAALAAIRRGPLPDILISDVMMPELDGFGLLRAVRDDEHAGKLMVMLLSARAGEEARLEGLGAGADDYIVKPFSARELIARVDSAITLARVRDGATRREEALLTRIEVAESRSALRRSEAQVDSVFEQTAAGVAEADLAGRLLRVNDRYCQILGYPREALLGQKIGAFIHPEDWPRNAALLAELGRTGRPFDLDNRFVRPDGRTVWVTKAIAPILGPDGDVATMLAVVFDISDRKEAEMRLIEADRNKDEFLAMLAHELRNPLAPISAAAALIGKVTLDQARLTRTSEVIARQVRHMTGLIDDLLDVSRVTRGHVTITKAPEDLKQVIANAVEQVKPLIEAHRHTLVLAACAQPVTVMGDQKRLVQVLTNLLNNAAKYTPAGGRIDVDLSARDGKAVVSIRDNGLGIARDVQARVFDLFSQAARTSDRSQGGLGLGLALAKSLVELHDGTIYCDSAGLGMGSTFTIVLPLAMAHAAPLPAPAAERGDAAGALRILVVDDNRDAADMLAMLLAASGHEVDVEHDSRTALAVAKQTRPDVCVLDIGLPGMDGNELAQRLRAQPETQECMLVAVTGYGQEYDRVKALAAGFDFHFAKPVDADQLRLALASRRTTGKVSR